MRFKHDCDKCKPLGEYGEADLYFCDALGPSAPTVIARHSSEGSDYTSGLELCALIPELGEARRRAISHGFL